MNKIKIIDNLIKSERKPIELIYCLQNSLHKVTDLPQWSLINSPWYDHILQLTRVGVHQIDNDTYDVIVADTFDDHQTFWLGHWNDGVVENQ